MAAAKPKWRRKIEGDLINWKKYKAFVKAAEIEKDLGNSRNENKEYIEKKIFIRKLDAYVSSLPPTQAYIIRSKYYILNEDFDRTRRYGGETRPDKSIWNDPEFGYQESRYFELKKEALKELAQKMGYF